MREKPDPNIAPKKVLHKRVEDVGDIRKKVTDVTMTQDEINKEVKDLWSEVMKQNGEAKVNHEEEMKTMQVLLRGTASRERKRVLDETEHLRREAQVEVVTAFERIKSLQSDLLFATTERDKWKQKATDATSTTITLKKQLADEQEAAAQQKVNFSDARDTISILRAEVTALHETQEAGNEARLRLITAEAELCDMRVQSTEDTLSLREQMNTLRSKLSTAESHAAKSRLATAETEQARIKAEELISKTQTEIEELKEHNATLEISLQHSTEQTESLTGSLSVANRDLTQARNEISRKDTELRDVLKVRRELEASLEKANSNIQALTCELDTTSKGLETLTVQVGNKTEAASTLEAQLAGLCDSIQSMEAADKGHSAKVGQMESSIEVLEKDKESLQKELRDLSTQKDSIDSARHHVANTAVESMAACVERDVLRRYYARLQRNACTKALQRYRHQMYSQRAEIAKLLWTKTATATLHTCWSMLRSHAAGLARRRGTAKVSHLEEELLTGEEQRALLEEEITRLEAEVMFQSSIPDSPKASPVEDPRFKEEMYEMQVLKQSAEFKALRTKRVLAAEHARYLATCQYGEAWRKLSTYALRRAAMRAKADLVRKQDECRTIQNKSFAASCNISELEAKLATLQGINTIRKQHVAEMNIYQKGLCLNIQKHEELMANRKKALRAMLSSASRKALLSRYYLLLVQVRWKGRSLKNCHDNASERNMELQRKASELTNQLEGERRTKAEHTNAIALLRQQINENAKAADALAVMNSENFVLKEQLKSLQEDLSGTREEASKLSASNTAHENHVSSLIAEMEVLEAAGSERDHQLRALSVERDGFKATVGRMHEERDFEREDMARKISSLMDIDSEAAGLRGLLDSREQEIAVLRACNEDGQHKLYDLKTSLDQAMLIVSEHERTVSKLSQELQHSQQHAALSDSRLRSAASKQVATEKFVRASIGVHNERKVYHTYFWKLKLHLRTMRRKRCLPQLISHNAAKQMLPAYASLQHYVKHNRFLRRRQVLCDVPVPHLRVIPRYWRMWVVWRELKKGVRLSTSHSEAIERVVAVKEEEIQASHNNIVLLEAELERQKEKTQQLMSLNSDTEDVKAGLVEEITSLAATVEEQKTAAYQLAVNHHDLETASQIKKKKGNTKKASVLQVITMQQTLRRCYVLLKKKVAWKEFDAFQKRSERADAQCASEKREKEALLSKLQDSESAVISLQYELKVAINNNETYSSVKRKEGRQSKLGALLKSTEVTVMRRYWWLLSVNAAVLRERQRTRLASELGMRTSLEAAAATRTHVAYLHSCSSRMLGKAGTHSLLTRYYHSLLVLRSRKTVRNIQIQAACSLRSSTEKLIVKDYYVRLQGTLDRKHSRSVQKVAVASLYQTAQRHMLSVCFNRLCSYAGLAKVSFRSAILGTHLEERDMIVAKSHNNLVATRFHSVAISAKHRSLALLQRYLHTLFLFHRKRMLTKCAVGQLGNSIIKQLVHRYLTIWSGYRRLRLAQKVTEDSRNAVLKVKDLTEAKKELESKLAEGAKAISLLETAGVQCATDCELLNTELAQTQVKMNGHVAEGRKLALLNSDLRSELEDKEQVAQELKRDIAKLEKINKKKKVTERDLRGTIQALQEENSILHGDNSELLEKKKETSKNEMVTAVRILELQNNIASLEEGAAAHEELKDKYSKLNAETESLQHSTQNLHSQNQELSQKLQDTTTALTNQKYTSDVAEEALQSKMALLKRNSNAAISMHLLHLNETRILHRCWVQLVLLKQSSITQKIMRESSSYTSGRAVLTLLQMRERNLLFIYYKKLQGHRQQNMHEFRLLEFERSVEEEKLEQEMCDKLTKTAFREQISAAIQRALSTQLMRATFLKLVAHRKHSIKRTALAKRCFQIEEKNTRVFMSRVYAAFTSNRTKKLKLKKLLSNSTGLRNLVAHDLMGGYLRKLRIFAATSQAAKTVSVLKETQNSVLDAMHTQHSSLAAKLEEELSSALAKGSYFEGKFVEEEAKYKKAKADLVGLHANATGLEKRAHSAEEQAADHLRALKQLREENEATEGRLKKWQKAHEDLSRESSATKHQLENSVNSYEVSARKKEKELQSSREETESLTAALRSKEAEFSKLSAMHNSLQEDFGSAKLSQTNERVSLERKLEEAHENNIKMHAERTEEREALQSDVEGLSLQLASTKLMLDSAKQDLKEAAEVELSLSTQLKEATSETMHLAEKIETTLHNTSERASEMEQQMRDLTEANDALEEVVNKAKLDNSEKAERIALLDGRLSQTTDERTELEEELYALKTQRGAIEASTEVMEKRCKELQETVAAGKTKLAEVVDELNVKSEALLTADDRVNHHEAALAKATRRTRELEEELAELTEQLAEHDNIEALMEEEIDALREEKGKKEEEHSDILETTVREKAEALAKIKDISMLANSAAEELAVCSDKSAEMEAELERCEATLHELEEKYATLKEEKRLLTEEKKLFKEKLVFAEEARGHAPHSVEIDPAPKLPLDDSLDNMDTSRLLSPTGHQDLDFHS
eukprot:TRINITY_DN7135_c0_g2_i1.p1 TRINITY_DN7135_c0_g2~~TRINITY_DN7135_c0_g2_i1.p1  ORF type:complete len:2529 (+),score=681.01 TRINITY_DN7135_c0_g2_i1:52-7638(+)